MTLARRLALAMLLPAAPLLGAGRCGGECPPPPERPPAMTELRARELDPAVVAGIAVSTTLITGDCRPSPTPLPVDACGNVVDTACSRARAALLVLAVPVNHSLPTSPDCDGGFPVEPLRELAVLEARASELGELVAALEPGRYTLYVSSDDRCAVCGVEDLGTACLIEVPEGRVAVRDLVIDRSTH